MVEADKERKTALDFAEANKPKPEALDIESHQKINLSISASKTAIQQKYSMNSLEDKTNGLGFKSLVALTAFSTSGTKEEGGLMKPGKKREKPMSALEEIMRKDELAKDQIKKKKVAPDDILATGSLKNVDGEGLYIKGEKSNKDEKKRESGKVVKLLEIVDEEEEP